MTRAVKIPDATHPITIRPTGSRVTVRVGGVKVAESDSALSLAEASYPVVQYVPIADVDQSLLRRTETDLIWTYEQPYPAVSEIAGHVAFYGNRAEITVDPAS